MLLDLNNLAINSGFKYIITSSNLETNSQLPWIELKLFPSQLIADPPKKILNQREKKHESPAYHESQKKRRELWLEKRISEKTRCPHTPTPTVNTALYSPKKIFHQRERKHKSPAYRERQKKRRELWLEKRISEKLRCPHTPKELNSPLKCVLNQLKSPKLMTTVKFN